MKIKFLIVIAAFISTTVYASKMKIALEDYDHPIQCKNELITVADDLIGPNEHRLNFLQKENNTLFPMLYGIIEYKDRISNISFNSQVNDKGECIIIVQQNFIDSSPCIETRNSIFSKWNHAGILSNTTMLLEKNEDNGVKHAILSDFYVSNKAVCSVQINESILFTH